MAKKRKKNVTTKRVQEKESTPFIPQIKAKPDLDQDDNGYDGLTIRQRLFVISITGPALGNGTKAAEMAGYASDNRNALAVTASENLRKPNVQQAIAHALAERCLSPEWAKKQLVDLCRTDMSNFLDVEPDGFTKPNLAKAASFGAINQIKEYDPETGKIKLHDRSRAIGLLLKLHGLINDSVEPVSPDKEIRVRVVDRGDTDNQS